MDKGTPEMSSQSRKIVTTTRGRWKLFRGNVEYLVGDLDTIEDENYERVKTGAKLNLSLPLTDKMSTEEPLKDPQPDSQPQPEQDAQMHDTPTSPAVVSKKRPRLDLTVDARERKRGKSMFGIVLGTLNKAKIEDKERNASEAAKKRQLIEQRLQAKLKKESDSVRRAEEAKRDKGLANRKEEDLQLKDSMQKLRRHRLPFLSNFLLTSDDLSSSDPDPNQSALPNPPKQYPPALYYLPAILTPIQQAFLDKRKEQFLATTNTQWLAFREEREAGIEDIKQLRQRVAEEEARKRAERASEQEAEVTHADAEMNVENAPAAIPAPMKGDTRTEEATMEVDTSEPLPDERNKEEKKDEQMNDDDDAVEY